MSISELHLLKHLPQRYYRKTGKQKKKTRRRRRERKTILILRSKSFHRREAYGKDKRDGQTQKKRLERLEMVAKRKQVTINMGGRDAQK